MMYLVSPNFSCISCGGQLFALSARRVASYCPSVVCIVTFLSVVSVLFPVFPFVSSAIVVLLLHAACCSGSVWRLLFAGSCV